MANIGATTAFYKVETSLTRANNEVSKSMERLATGKQNATAGDRSSYKAMADTFKLDYVATKAGIRSASVVMGYLETGLRTLDTASGVLSRLQELAVLAANDSNTDADLKAIDAEAEALGDEFHRLLSTAKYKGKDLFLSAAGGEYVSLGGRDAEMTFGIKKIQYSNLYLHSYAEYGNEFTAAIVATTGDDTNPLANNTADIKEYLRSDTIVNGAAYEVQKVSDAKGAAGAADDEDNEFLTFGATDKNATNEADSVEAGDKFVATASGTLKEQGTGKNYNWVVKQEGQLLYSASEGLLQNAAAHGSTTAAVNTDLLIDQIEDVQAKINTARVQAGSQYAALESAVGYVTDLTAQYELGYNTVNDVNFSMETAHLAKNQILQQAATAMLAQANQGQQSLLQLIQG
jgi:flagellin